MTKTYMAIEKAEAKSLAINIVVWLVHALIILWVCAILLPICPAIAVVVGLTYWDWLGILLGVRMIIYYLRRIIHK